MKELLGGSRSGGRRNVRCITPKNSSSLFTVIGYIILFFNVVKGRNVSRGSYISELDFRM
jgi:hypothetical protein